ncbi:MAG: hypothetical protein ACT452_17745 [Microthrixaceae bacterium]
MVYAEPEPLRISGRLKDALIADLVRDPEYDADGILRRGAGNDPFDWTDHLARQLGLSTRYRDERFAGLHDTLLVVLPELDELLSRWPPEADARALQPITESATRGLTEVEVYATMLAGSKAWRNTPIGADVQLDKLAGHLRAILVRTLAASLSDLLRRWNEWDVRSIREQRAEALRREQEERAEATAEARAMREAEAKRPSRPKSKRIPPPPGYHSGQFQPPGPDWSPKPPAG